MRELCESSSRSALSQSAAAKVDFPQVHPCGLKQLGLVVIGCQLQRP